MRQTYLVATANAANGDENVFGRRAAENLGKERNQEGRNSLGNFYVSDGNNGRISVWSLDMQYKTFFGFGSADSALNLPRGIWMDAKDHLLVADAVGQFIRVYDVSGAEPVFIYNIGTYGALEGQFNFPNDICMDASGRVYIADRENNRVQIWSY